MASSYVGKEFYTYSAIYREPKPNGKLMLRHRKRSKYLGDDSTTTTKVSFQLDRQVSHKHHLRSAKKKEQFLWTCSPVFVNSLLMLCFSEPTSVIQCVAFQAFLFVATHICFNASISPFGSSKRQQHRISQQSLCVWETNYHHYFWSQSLYATAIMCGPRKNHMDEPRFT